MESGQATNSVLPSPLWGGSRAKRAGWGSLWWREARASQRPPPPTPPHKGEGSTPSTPHDYASSTIENSQHRVLPISPFSHGLSRSPLRTAVLVPAARFCARGLKLWLRYPEFKGWRSAERRTDACEASVGPARNAAGQALRRRLASHNAGRPPLGALTVAIFGSGAALLSPAFAPDQSQRAPRARVVVPGSRLSVTSRDDGSRAVATGRHSSLRIQVWLENTPQLSKDANLYLL